MSNSFLGMLGSRLRAVALVLSPRTHAPVVDSALELLRRPIIPPSINSPPARTGRKEEDDSTRGTPIGQVRTAMLLSRPTKLPSLDNPSLEAEVFSSRRDIRSDSLELREYRDSYHYERLEWLGDRIFNMIGAQLTFILVPPSKLGERDRPMLFQEHDIYQVVTSNNFAAYLADEFQLGDSEAIVKSRADAFEAYVAALYLSKGYGPTLDFLAPLVYHEIRRRSLIFDNLPPLDTPFTSESPRLVPPHLRLSLAEDSAAPSNMQNPGGQVKSEDQALNPDRYSVPTFLSLDDARDHWQAHMATQRKYGRIILSSAGRRSKLRYSVQIGKDTPLKSDSYLGLVGLAIKKGYIIIDRSSERRTKVPAAIPPTPTSPIPAPPSKPVLESTKNTTSSSATSSSSGNNATHSSATSDSSTSGSKSSPPVATNPSTKPSDKPSTPVPSKAPIEPPPRISPISPPAAYLSAAKALPYSTQTSTQVTAKVSTLPAAKKTPTPLPIIAPIASATDKGSTPSPTKVPLPSSTKAASTSPLTTVMAIKKKGASNEPVPSKAPPSTSSLSASQKSTTVKAATASSTPASTSPPSSAELIPLSPVKPLPSSATAATSPAKKEDDVAISLPDKSPISTTKDDEGAAIDGVVSLEMTAAGNLSFEKNSSDLTIMSNKFTSSDFTPLSEGLLPRHAESSLPSRTETSADRRGDHYPPPVPFEPFFLDPKKNAAAELAAQLTGRNLGHCLLQHGPILSTNGTELYLAILNVELFGRKLFGRGRTAKAAMESLSQKCINRGLASQHEHITEKLDQKIVSQLPLVFTSQMTAFKTFEARLKSAGLSGFYFPPTEPLANKQGVWRLEIPTLKLFQPCFQEASLVRAAFTRGIFVVEKLYEELPPKSPSLPPSERFTAYDQVLHASTVESDNFPLTAIADDKSPPTESITDTAASESSSPVISTAPISPILATPTARTAPDSPILVAASDALPSPVAEIMSDEDDSILALLQSESTMRPEDTSSPLPSTEPLSEVDTPAAISQAVRPDADSSGLTLLESESTMPPEDSSSPLPSAQLLSEIDSPATISEAVYSDDDASILALLHGEVTAQPQGSTPSLSSSHSPLTDHVPPVASETPSIYNDDAALLALLEGEDTIGNQDGEPLAPSPFPFVQHPIITEVSPVEEEILLYSDDDDSILALLQNEVENRPSDLITPIPSSETPSMMNSALLPSNDNDEDDSIYALLQSEVASFPTDHSSNDTELSDVISGPVVEETDENIVVEEEVGASVDTQEMEEEEELDHSDEAILARWVREEDLSGRIPEGGPDVGVQASGDVRLDPDSSKIVPSSDEEILAGLVDKCGEENVGEGDSLEEAGESSLSGTKFGGKL